MTGVVRVVMVVLCVACGVMCGGAQANACSPDFEGIQHNMRNGSLAALQSHPAALGRVAQTVLLAWGSMYEEADPGMDCPDVYISKTLYRMRGGSMFVVRVRLDDAGIKTHVRATTAHEDSAMVLEILRDAMVQDTRGAFRRLLRGGALGRLDSASREQLVKQALCAENTIALAALFGRGASINPKGNTPAPLLIAASANNVRMVRWLLRRGADLEHWVALGPEKTSALERANALDHALMTGSDDSAAELRRRGLKPLLCSLSDCPLVVPDPYGGEPQTLFWGSMCE